VLLVDAGNTDTVVARIAADADPVGAELEPLCRVPTGREAAAAADLARRILAGRQPREAVVISTVVPSVAAALTGACPEAAVIDHRWDLPFAVGIGNPHTVGADRWCNVAAAAASGLDHAIVVDAGTATTIDVLRDGVFVGGLIAPGMAFAARQLQTLGARLWEVPFAPCPLEPGRDTEAALRAGAYHVGLHGVAGVVGALLAGEPGAAVRLTGGLGGHLARPGWPHDPHWTLRGMAALHRRRPPAAG
jgi:type III pantothenate kinase